VGWSMGVAHGYYGPGLRLGGNANRGKGLVPQMDY